MTSSLTASAKEFTNHQFISASLSHTHAHTHKSVRELSGERTVINISNIGGQQRPIGEDNLLS